MQWWVSALPVIGQAIQLSEEITGVWTNSPSTAQYSHSALFASLGAFRCLSVASEAEATDKQRPKVVAASFLLEQDHQPEQFLAIAV